MRLKLRSALRNDIAPHRAVYEISLARTESGSGVSSAKGRMVFEVTGIGLRRLQNAPAHGRQYRRRGRECRPSRFPHRHVRVGRRRASTPSIPARSMNEEVVEAVEGEARRSGCSDRGQPEAADGEEGHARRRRAFPEPASAGDHRRRARRPERSSPPTSTRARGRARRATRPPPRSVRR